MIENCNRFAALNKDLEKEIRKYKKDKSDLKKQMEILAERDKASHNYREELEKVRIMC